MDEVNFGHSAVYIVCGLLKQFVSDMEMNLDYHH